MATLPLFDAFDGEAPVIVEPVIPHRSTPRERAQAWLDANPRVLHLLEQLAKEEAQYGRFGMKYLFEILRYRVRRTWKKDAAGFKLNNDFTATAARILIERNPALKDLIELRECADEREERKAA